MSRADLDKQPGEVAAMFDGVARGYDRTNTVLTLGWDHRWRDFTRRALASRPGERVLDLAAGTGVSTVEYARDGAYCVAADFSLGMLTAGLRRGVPMVAADAVHLPFSDACFDAVTISFGLRNIADTGAALREMARVTKPGGRLVICEFATPGWRPFRRVYETMLTRVMPAVAQRVSSNAQAYTYLAESIHDWPEQRELAETIAANDWRDVAWRDLTGGVVAVHRAVRP